MKGVAMTPEIRAKLVTTSNWVICAILCFGFGYTAWGYVFIVKVVLDVLFNWYTLSQEAK